jgi:hypothetical protein
MGRHSNPDTRIRSGAGVCQHVLHMAYDHPAGMAGTTSCAMVDGGLPPIPMSQGSNRQTSAAIWAEMRNGPQWSVFTCLLGEREGFK